MNQIFHTVLLVPGLRTGQSTGAPAVTLSCRRAGVILSRAAHPGTLAGLFRRLKACVYPQLANSGTVTADVLTEVELIR